MSGLLMDDPAHRAFLAEDARRALDFFDASAAPGGGFHVLDCDGTPLGTEAELHVTTRLVHSYSLGQMAGRADRADIVDRGMAHLWHAHRDDRHGGYHWAPGRPDGPKLAYGHVFVLLAAASARMAGHPEADRLLADADGVLERHFWDEDRGLLRDEYTRDWRAFSDYRGMNANMHGVEAMLAAFEATGEERFLTRAGRILSFLIGAQAARNGWRIPEHYDANWRPVPDYAGDPMFRPPGTTPGHSFEMARLLLHWWDLAGRPGPEAPAQARALVETALADAWDGVRGGLAYTMDRGRVLNGTRYWWPVTEAIGALAALIKLEGQAGDDAWYRRLWAFAARHLIDRDRGGWYPELDALGRPAATQFAGKPDIYHALQADLLPLAGGLSRQVRDLSRDIPLHAMGRPA